MMRRSTAILLALLAAAALPAAKPVPPADVPGGGAQDDARERWRGQGISVCVAALRPVPELSPDDLEGICGCAIDRYLEGAGSTQQAALEPGPFPAALRSGVISCTFQVRPERVSDVARLTRAAPPTPPPVVETPPANELKPVDDDNGPANAETGGESSGGGFWAWLGNLGWPAWLTGASVLWWIAIGIFVFGLLVLRFRRRDPRKDLSAPPSYMRKGMPPPPRRPDLPR